MFSSPLLGCPEALAPHWAFSTVFLPVDTESCCAVALKDRAGLPDELRGSADTSQGKTHPLCPSPCPHMLCPSSCCALGVCCSSRLPGQGRKLRWTWSNRGGYGEVLLVPFHLPSCSARPSFGFSLWWVLSGFLGVGGFLPWFLKQKIFQQTPKFTGGADHQGVILMQGQGERNQTEFPDGQGCR